ncbi:MAG TPA: TetR/AcrR family transcriptional regulator [Ktedonobacterales bacterium]|jgi:AcrR family transcriptional regulator|nr:TetR/AcrR family transcriptional regulator [Ktedonobacterales bacterium]
MSGGSKRQQQAEERRNQLIDVALELFGQRGIEATRVSDIAQAAGVAQGLLYHYFPSKDALLSAIVEREGPLAMLHELLAAPSDRPARETLLDLATRLYGLIQQRRSLLRLIVREVIWQPEMLRFGMAVREQALGMLSRYLQSRIAAGELRPHDPQVVGQLLASNVILVAIAGLPIDPYLTGAVDVILQGIAAEPADDASPQTEPTGD